MGTERRPGWGQGRGRPGAAQGSGRPGGARRGGVLEEGPGRGRGVLEEGPGRGYRGGGAGEGRPGPGQCSPVCRGGGALSAWSSCSSPGGRSAARGRVGERSSRPRCEGCPPFRAAVSAPSSSRAALSQRAAHCGRGQLPPHRVRLGSSGPPSRPSAVCGAAALCWRLAVLQLTLPSPWGGHRAAGALTPGPPVEPCSAHIAVPG